MSIQENDEFEFSVNCSSNSSVATPVSPCSPADHFFINGRLLPHSFPSQNYINNNLYNYRAIYSRSTSRASSVSSKDSFASSRSSSTSICSSARTSTSENPEHMRKLTVLTNQQLRINNNVTRNSSADDEQWRRYPKKPVLNYQCRSSSSQRWQFITAVPAIKRNVFCSRKRGNKKGAQSKRTKPKKRDNKDGSISGTWFGLRFFMSFVSACMKCHSFKPSSSSNVHHAGQPMAGEEQEDIVVTSTQCNLLNVTCPLTGKPVTHLEEPVRSVDCKHVYEKNAVMQYMRSARKCPVAGCPNRNLQSERVIRDQLLLVDIEELRVMSKETGRGDVIEDFTNTDDEKTSEN